MGWWYRYRIFAMGFNFSATDGDNGMRLNGADDKTAEVL